MENGQVRVKQEGKGGMVAGISGRRQSLSPNPDSIVRLGCVVVTAPRGKNGRAKARAKTPFGVRTGKEWGKITNIVEAGRHVCIDYLK